MERSRGRDAVSPLLSFIEVESSGKHWMKKWVAGVMESSTHWIMHASNSESRGEMMIDAPVLSQEGCRKMARMKGMK